MAVDSLEASIIATAPTRANWVCRRKMVYEESLFLYDTMDDAESTMMSPMKTSTL